MKRPNAMYLPIAIVSSTTPWWPRPARSLSTSSSSIVVVAEWKLVMPSASSRLIDAT